MENISINKRLAQLEIENEKLRSDHRTAKKNEYKETGYALIIFGTLTLGMSYFTYNNTILASILLFAGIGTTYIGILSLFLTPEKFVRKDILEQSNLSSIAVINNIIQELQIYSKGIYVSAKGQIRVILPLRPDFELSKDIPQRTFHIDEPGKAALVLVPLGYSLMQMVEDRGTDWSDLSGALNEIMVEGLEIARSVEVINGDIMNEDILNGKTITVTVNEPVYMKMCSTASTETPRICDIGCPFCSLIACIITKSTGNNIVIEEAGHGKNNITAKFKLLTPDINP
ncbi:MAG: hypothetical protein O8C59_02160 [Candidatus Methanoperedens sp.]|nr:hypothetical protein [Candidatus Methanoperedens sp.]